MRLIFLLLAPGSVFGASLFTAETRYSHYGVVDPSSCGDRGADWANCETGYIDGGLGAVAGAGFQGPFGIAAAWARASSTSILYSAYGAASFDFDLVIDLADPGPAGITGYLILNGYGTWSSSLGEREQMLPYVFGQTFRVTGEARASASDRYDASVSVFNSIDVFNAWGAWIGNLSTSPDASGRYLIGPPPIEEGIATPEPGSLWLALPVLMLAGRTVRRDWRRGCGRRLPR